MPVMPVMNEGSQPILPPRPTGRSFVAEKPRSMWKSWPMLVIVLASVAIVVAVVLMVWPPSSGHETKRALQPPPAPERMETNPLPPPGAGNSNGADPWGGHSQADPPKAPQASPDPAAPTPRQTPDPLPPPDPQQDPDDLFGQLGPMPQLPNLFDPNADPMAQLAPLLKQMPNVQLDDVDAQAVQQVCTSFKAMAKAAPSSCTDAQKCISQIDQLCGQGASLSSMTLMQSITSCTAALSSC